MPAEITPLPTPPSRSDPANFAARGDEFLGALPLFQSEANLVAGEVNAAASAAAASADAAALSETNSAASAASAVNAPGTSSTSTSSVTVGTGTKSFTTQTGKNFVVGMRINVASTVAPATNAMYGVITAYNPGTGALNVSVDTIIGSGTIANWTISLSGLTGIVSGAGFTPTLNTSSPNGTVSVAALSATGAQTNIDAALVAKGTGAILAQIPDNTTTGGNKRGLNAIDLQNGLRTNANQVAGGGNSALLSGQFNRASGNTAGVMVGFNNHASGNGAFVGGGGYNLADGIYSAILAGFFGTNRGVQGVETWGVGSSVAGERQREIFSLVARTGPAPATPTVLTSEGSAAASFNVPVMPNNSSYKVEGQVIARQYSGASGTVGDTVSWSFKGTFTRGANAASTAVLDSVTVTKEADSAGATAWALTLTANTTLGAPVLTFTGEANKNIDVIAEMRTVEVTA